MRHLTSLLLWLPLAVLAAVHPPQVHHQLSLRLVPDQGRLSATDRISLPTPVEKLEFLLHDGLAPRLLSPSGRLRALAPVAATVPAQRYLVEFERPTNTLELQWQGVISHPVERDGPGPQTTPGLIAPEGVWLGGESLWYPWLDDRLVTFDLKVTLPEGWRAISPGYGSEPNRFATRQPQEAIVLVAGRFAIHRDQGTPTAAVWLRHDDPELARRYLRATREDLDLYSKLIGPYPYAGFTLVENFWESGWGLPGFTLLGPRVIRLPFLLASSYPHEILHNWWGNAVYPDPNDGNWAEGLTAYLADHLFKERQGRGAAYRRRQLAAYSRWVREGRDLPLVAFRARHDQASQAAGYGRMLMFAHALRLTLGDETFVAGLRRFYADNRFALAGFDDLRRAFEQVSGADLRAMFRQWTRRTGAPRLRLTAVRSRAEGDGYRLSGELRQEQAEAPFALRVPLYVQLEGRREPLLKVLEMNDRHLAFSFELPARPLRVVVDPLFDLFRRLAPDELPPALAGLLGSDRVILVVPEEAPAARRAAWSALAKAWQRRYPHLEVRADSQAGKLPGDARVVVLGAENRLAGRAWADLAGLPVKHTEDAILIAGRRLDPGHTALALAGPRLGLILAPAAETIPLLARKLPHYSRYGYLAFDAQGRNQLKGEWPSTARSLSAALDPQAPPLEVPDHPPLARLAR